MSLDHILLGILRTPASGYEVKQQFDNVFSHFWPANLPQIYRTLNRLAQDGLLSVAAERSSKGPDRRVYRVTAAGKRAFRRWLTTAPTLATERLGYVAQTFFLGALEDDAEALDFLRELRRVLAGELEALQRIATEWAVEDPRYPEVSDREDFYGQLTLDLGLHKLAAKVAWADRSIARLEARMKEDGHERIA
jgi:DNA-binding PadR family transcriptional regulator